MYPDPFSPKVRGFAGRVRLWLGGGGVHNGRIVSVHAAG